MEHFVPSQVKLNDLFHIYSMNKFANRFYEIRKENGYSRSYVAEKLFVSVRLISYWENGKRECDFNMLIKISDFFGVSIDYLLGKKDF